MKKIHPKYNKKTKVECSCGAVFEFGSTLDDYKVEICSNCHPAYTGNKKLVDTAGRVDRFRDKLKKSQELKDRLNQPKKKEKEIKKEEESK